MTSIRPCLFTWPGPAPRRTLTDEEWEPIRQRLEEAHYARCREAHEHRARHPVIESVTLADSSRDGSRWLVEVREDVTLHPRADGRWMATATQSTAPEGAEIAVEGLSTLTKARREAERLALVVGGRILDSRLVLDIVGPDVRITNPKSGWWREHR